ncbi:hypothetical protein N7540_008865 [Penicillium herquei]|nr:hypothetical protein N7540_008865 [Penicillium herquei]
MCIWYCAVCERELGWPPYGPGDWRDSWRALYSIEGDVYLSEPYMNSYSTVKTYLGVQLISYWDKTRLPEFAIKTLIRMKHQSYFNKDHKNINIFHSACWDHAARFLGIGTAQLDLENVFGLFASIQFKRYFLTDRIKEKWTPFLPKRQIFKTRDNFSIATSLIKHREHLITIPTDDQRDPFARLPAEIKLEISEFLPMNDYLHLRQVSRAMFSLFDSPAFWRARFLVHSDRGYLDFLTENGVHGNWDTLKAEDWLKIYRQTSVRGTVAGRPSKWQKGRIKGVAKGRASGSRWIHSRHGIWNKMKWLQNQLGLSNIMTEITNEVPEFELPVMDTDVNTKIKWCWQVGRTRLWDGSSFTPTSRMNSELPTYNNCRFRPLSPSCGSESTQKLALHESVTQIGFWIVVVNGETYITGLELISIEESIPNGKLGYRSCNGNLVTVNIKSAEQLRGFQISAVHESISAIRLYLDHPAELISEENLKFHLSKWVGSPRRSNDRSYYTHSEKRIIALGASFVVS